MLLRNREVRRALVSACALTLMGTLVAYLGTLYVIDHTPTEYFPVAAAISDTEAIMGITLHSPARIIAGVAAACAFATGALVTSVFMLLTRRRYQSLAHLAEKLDRVLSGERDIRLRDMDEGELAILSSEIDKAVSRLHLAVDELQAEKVALSDALADISHQLKTPLTSIAISTELIRERLSDRDDARDIVEKLRLVQRLQRRVEDLVAVLLKLARIDAGVIKLVRGRVSAEELVRRSFDPLAVAFDIADVSFTSSIQEGSGFEGDLNWSVEALGNILKNCMEHTPAGGNVSVKVTEDVLACRIHIEDTGEGISDADLPHIFERFYRGSSEASEREVDPAGVGIGLALAKSLVSAQDGTISAENATDAQGIVTGAVFTITFFKAVV